MKAADKSLAGVRIVMADDTEFQREILKMRLANLGADVVAVFENGTDLLAYLNDNSDYDCVVSDNHMPGLNGIQVAAARKGDKPFILWTATTQDKKFLDTATDSRVIQVLSKTVSNNRLKTAIEESLSCLEASASSILTDESAELAS